MIIRYSQTLVAKYIPIDMLQKYLNCPPVVLLIVLIVLPFVLLIVDRLRRSLPKNVRSVYVRSPCFVGALGLV